jgi:hypothetical protein
MAMQLKYLLARYELLGKVLSYVKDEGANLNTFTNQQNTRYQLISLTRKRRYHSTKDEVNETRDTNLTTRIKLNIIKTMH